MKCARDNALPPALVSLASCNAPAVSKFGAPAVSFSLLMREAKKSLKGKGIKSEDVKNLPPIKELCKPIPRSSSIEVHSLQRFDNRDIPYSKLLINA
jgi:hypothetical protein